VWTSQCDNRYADGTWHAVDLPYIGEECDSSSAVRHIYGQSDIITGDRDFEFTYRLKVSYQYMLSDLISVFAVTLLSHIHMPH